MSRALPEDQNAKLEELLFQRRKIEAIKVYRELADVGLKEAKEDVEVLERALLSKYPEKFVPAKQSKGCFGATAVICIVVAVALWFTLR